MVLIHNWPLTIWGLTSIWCPSWLSHLYKTFFVLLSKLQKQGAPRYLGGSPSSETMYSWLWTIIYGTEPRNSSPASFLSLNPCNPRASCHKSLPGSRLPTCALKCPKKTSTFDTGTLSTVFWRSPTNCCFTWEDALAVGAYADITVTKVSVCLPRATWYSLPSAGKL